MPEMVKTIDIDDIYIYIDICSKYSYIYSKYIVKVNSKEIHK